MGILFLLFLKNIAKVYSSSFKNGLAAYDFYQRKICRSLWERRPKQFGDFVYNTDIAYLLAKEKKEKIKRKMSNLPGGLSRP